MKTINIAEELGTYLTLPYPFVWLETYEEDRALAMLQPLCSALQLAIRVYRPAIAEDSNQALDQALDDAAAPVERGVFVIIDPGRELLSARNQRRLKELRSSLEKRGNTLLFLSPEALPAQELLPDWATLHLPLPTLEELTEIASETFGVNEGVEHLANAARGLTAREARRAFLRAQHQARVRPDLAADPSHWSRAIVEEKQRRISSEQVLEFHDLDSSLDDVGGLDNLRLWTKGRMRAFHPSARRFGLPMPRGILLLGVQGCGKSLAARAIAHEWGIPLVRLNLNLVCADDSGLIALEKALRTVEAMAPLVLWVDELEKSLGDTTQGTGQRALGSLLTWLQQRQAPIFFAATANRVQSLPPELLRRGRLDEIFFVDLPTAKDREAIFAVHLKSRMRDPQKFDLPAFAKASENFSGAEIEQAVVDALFRAFARGEELTNRDILIELSELRPLYTLMEEEIKALRRWSEERARPAARNDELIDLFRAR